MREIVTYVINHPEFYEFLYTLVIPILGPFFIGFFAYLGWQAAKNRKKGG